MKKKYRALRIVSGILKVIAWIILILGILGFFGMIIAGVFASRGTYGYGMPYGQMPPFLGGVIGGILGGIGVLIYSFLSFLFTLAAADLIMLAVSVEENTRETAYFLRTLPTVNVKVNEKPAQQTEVKSEESGQQTQQ
ncbi:hypothetical protein JXI42_02765 [bacterium]|nr:hypothetical protein [bacterium]